MSVKIAVRGLDIQVTPLNSAQVVDKIRSHAISKLPLRIANFNLHAAYLYHTDPRFARFCDESDLALIDGWPIWLMARLSSGRVPGPECRIGSSDWLQHLLDSADEHMTIVAVGGTETSSALAAEKISSTYPNIKWHGFDGFSSRHGITPGMEAAVSGADLILVGMGMPLQEAWIEEHKHHFADKVVANIGGCIDYFAGTQRHAPRWSGKIGLEWLFRLIASPRRLWRRYLLEPFHLIFVLTANKRKRIGG